MKQIDMFSSDDHYDNIDDVYRFFSRTLSKTKYSAKKIRKIAFYIDIDDVMNLYKKQKGNCALTGKPLEFTRGGDFGYGCNPNAATIDRIDSRFGYSPDNIQLTRWVANSTKSSFGNQEFIDLCNDIANTNSNK